MAGFDVHLFTSFLPLEPYLSLFIIPRLQDAEGFSVQYVDANVLKELYRLIIVAELEDHNRLVG